MDIPSPTRTNLLALKSRGEAAQRGLELLRSKREALVRELFAAMDRAVAARERLSESLRRGARALAVAQGTDGRHEVASAAFAARRDFPVDVVERIVWGVRIAEIRHPGPLRAADARGYAFSGVCAATGTAAREFEAALEVALRLAAEETRLKRVGGEVRRVTRRVNALTEILLPRIRRQLRSIRIVLEEREREEAFRMKRHKGRGGNGRG